MIRFIIALLFIQAALCAEFPNLEKYIKLAWNNVSLTGQIDGSQTKSNKDNSVPLFTLCGAYNNSDYRGDCSYNFSYAIQVSGSVFSGSGSGSFIGDYVSKTSETYSCLNFVNPVPAFRTIYNATETGTGQWNVSYSCKKAPKKVPWGIIVGVIIGVLVIVGGVVGYKYWMKKKNSSGKGGETTGRDGLLQNA